MGTSHIAFKDLFRTLGNTIISPPKPTQKTLSLGTKYSPEFACLPYKIILGTYIECLERGADTLVTSGGHGPCRAGHYAQLHEKILKDLGYDFEMLIFDQPRRDLRGFFHNIRVLNTANLSLLAMAREVRRVWEKLKALDSLEQLSHRIRPLEQEQGTVTTVYRKALKRVDAAHSTDEISKAFITGKEELLSIPTKPDFVPYKVGMVGEIYVLLEPFANLDVEETLENLGAYVERSIYLTGWTRENTISDTLGRTGGMSIKEAASPYLDQMVGGHGQDSVGNTIIYAKRGFDGIIHLAPFTCIPEIVAKSILPQVSKDYNIPVMSLSYDEQTARAGMVTRLEAFIDLMERKRHHKTGKIQEAS